MHNGKSVIPRVGRQTGGSPHVVCFSPVSHRRLLRVRHETAVVVGPAPPDLSFAGCFFPSGAVRCLTSKAPALVCHLKYVPGRCSRRMCCMSSRHMRALESGLVRVYRGPRARLSRFKTGTHGFVLARGAPFVRYKGVISLLGSLWVCCDDRVVQGGIVV